MRPFLILTHSFTFISFFFSQELHERRSKTMPSSATFCLRALMALFEFSNRVAARLSERTAGYEDTFLESFTGFLMIVMRPAFEANGIGPMNAFSVAFITLCFDMWVCV